MRLLRSITLEFETFEGDDVPPYAILSHTWGKDEVSYQEMLNGKGKFKAGYEKIKRCGQIAAKHSPALEFFWVDTCCIDKSSSAELSEAINSMFFWYESAKVCYAYLSDVSATSHFAFNFEYSRWFSRGWTLQELIAPSNLIFFSKDWKQIGTKETLKEHIQKTTGINIEALEGASLSEFSVAERMSWASKRETTRIEDMAYSLMGIFDVNMPLIYGERDKAFLRLQEEIMKISDDQSIFAWTDEFADPWAISGVLARSPAQFARSGSISSLGVWGKGGAFSVTNKGLRINLFLIQNDPHSRIYLASLDCFYESSMEESPAIYVMDIASRRGSSIRTVDTQFVRVRIDKIRRIGGRSKISGEYKAVHVQQIRNFQWIPKGLNALSLFHIINERGIPCRVYPAERYNPQSDYFSTPLRVGKVGGIVFKHDGMHYMIILGISDNGNPWTEIIPKLSQQVEDDWVSFEATGRELTRTSLRYEIESRPFQIRAETTQVFNLQIKTFEVNISAGRVTNDGS